MLRTAPVSEAKLDKLTRLAVVLGALLAGGGIFYHYVIYLPEVDRRKQVASASEKREQQAKELERQVTYESCKDGARKDYAAGWGMACQSVARDRQVSLRDCLIDPAVMTNQYLGANYCKRTYAAGDPGPECSLPRARADSLNQLFKEAQEKCLSEAKAGI